MGESSKRPAQDRSVFFIRKESLPVWIGFIAAAIIVFHLYGQYYTTEDEDQARNLLNTNAELLATILAVTMSFLILGLQFLAESYTPRALANYLRDKVVYGFPILYIVLISLNLISITFPTILPPADFLQYAILGTIISLVYLVAFLYYITNKIQPERLMAELHRKIRADVLEDIIREEGVMVIDLPKFRSFIILEQTMMKAISNNDMFSFAQGLEIVFAKLNNYMNRLNRQYHKDFDKSAYAKNSGYVYRFFARFFSQMEAECFSQNREQFISQYIIHLFQTFKIVYQHKNTWAVRNFWEQLDYVGLKTFTLEMRGAADLYIIEVRRISHVEFETIRRHKRSFVRDPVAKANVDDRIMDMILAEHFESDRLDSLTSFGVIAAEKKIETLVSSVIFALEAFLEDAFSIPDVITKRVFLWHVLDAIETVHKAAVKNGMKHSGAGFLSLDYRIETIGSSYPEGLEMITESYCNMALQSVEHDSYFVITSLGANGRTLIEDHPELVLIILDTLKKSYSIIKNNPNYEERNRRLGEVLKEIQSIESWNKNHDSKVTTKVGAILNSLQSGF